LTKSYKIVYNVDYDANLCVDIAVLAVVLTDELRNGGARDVKNIPAQKASEKEGARFQKKNENCRWQKCSEKKTCKRQKETHLLSSVAT
jgi:hypothetical protein